MLRAAARRLPGIRFEPRPAPLAEALPRMDVAAFVGFAASGPLHVPVAIEDPAQFSAIFGEAAPLAWDAGSGETVRSRLAPAVQAFFANGGRRCWVVRVAGDDAADNYFPLPGVAVVRPKRGQKLFPAFARARSRGRWSDGFEVGTGMQLLPLQPLAGDEGGADLVLSAASPRPVKGDLVRFAYAEGYVRFAAAESAQVVALSPPGTEAVAIRLSKEQHWLERIGHVGSPPGESFTQAKLYDTCVRSPAAPGLVFPEPGEAHPFERVVAARLHFANGMPALELAVAPREAPRPGALVGVSFEGEPAWLVVENVEFVEARQSPLQTAASVRGALWRRLDGRPAGAPRLEQVAVVSLDLRVRQGERTVSTLSGLGFAPKHPRNWNALEPDESHFSKTSEVVRTLPFPLAGAEAALPAQPPDEPDEAWFLPLALTSRLDETLPALTQARTPLERDGLSRFGPELFLDPELAEAGAHDVMAQADAIRYLRDKDKVRPLKGIHAVLGFDASAVIDEVTLVAVPDAAHRGWELVLPPEVPNAGETKQAVVEPKGPFKGCDIRSIEAPQLYAPAASDEDGTFTLSWSSPERGHYELEEATQPGFEETRVIFQGDAQRITLYSRSPGHYFYRVSVRVGRNTSPWSRGVAVRVGADTRWELKPLEDYRDEALFDVHRALLRMCAGRADLLAVLSLPLHYREDQAIAHAQRLRSFDRFEPRIHSYAALYHPWVVQRREDGRLDEVPPDGIACGVLALRAAQRGAWVAPANEPLRGLIALAPGAASEHWQALQQAQVNVVRQHPRGFLVLAEDTLTDDADLRPINVRRLLILLRRLALRRGATYVFEPLNAAFRRMVERGFEEVLADLFRRGAFAGATPERAYQVSAGADVNPPQALDQGRFVVELKVAPSLPMTFLSVRLVRSGERLAVAEGR
jgi:hypothetical protein